MTEDEIELLRLAREKAEKLLAELIAKRDDLERQPPPAHVEPAKYAQGRQAFANAIASAQRTLDALNEAAKLT